MAPDEVGAEPVRSARTGRRSPDEARAEIVRAAEAFLWSRPFRELTVNALMAGTSIGRSAFYAYFRDRNHLVTVLLDALEAQLREAAQPWLEGSDDPVSDIEASLRRVVEVWVQHGPVLRAIADAATQDPEVEAIYRWGLLERFIEAIAERLRQEQRRGSVAADLDAAETAAALILLNERYLVDRLGRTPQADPQAVFDTMRRVWTQTLYPQPSR